MVNDEGEVISFGEGRFGANMENPSFAAIKL